MTKCAIYSRSRSPISITYKLSLKGSRISNLFKNLGWLEHPTYHDRNPLFGQWPNFCFPYISCDISLLADVSLDGLREPGQAIVIIITHFFLFLCIAFPPPFRYFNPTMRKKSSILPISQQPPFCHSRLGKYQI